MIEKPMNPYAERDFTHAMREASETVSKKFEDFSEDLKRIGEQIKVNAEEGVMSFIDFADIGEEYSGAIKLPYTPNGAWNDVFNILALHGYAVSAEVETEDGEQYVVIAFEEVE